MHPLLGLIFWGMVGGYFIGRKKDRGLLYALLGIPVSLGVYVAVIASVSMLAG